ncbi:MAG: hypothetical protein PHF86_05255 [Candidatus Nanoarchaeia archaeon]|jgi:hypothetical protein|nr:hypothetical protein [Candidatus Nanoarchaeia archaeon]
MGKYIWWVVTLSLTILVYCDKIFDMKAWYVDNLVKMFFVYNVLMASLTFLMVILLSYLSRHIESITTSHEKTLNLSKEFEKPLFQISKVISVLVTVFYGVTGCWWFFTFSCIQICSILIMTQQTKDIVKSYKAAHPEAKMPETDEPEKKKKVDKKAKFKFLKET